VPPGRISRRQTRPAYAVTTALVQVSWVTLLSPAPVDALQICTIAPAKAGREF
jgi:hypothetical protein